MKSSKQMQMEEIEKAEVFADPTYDVTFKMLFGSEKNIGKFDLNFQYIQDHIDETDSQIMGGMDIEMD
jgi:hypothetical protein